MTNQAAPRPATRDRMFQGAAIVLVLAALVGLLVAGLLAGLLAALAGYALTRTLAGTAPMQRAGRFAASLSATVVIVVVSVVLVVAGVELWQFIAVTLKNFAALRDHLVAAVAGWRAYLPAAIAAQVPTEPEALQAWIAQALRAQTPTLAGIGRSWGHGLFSAFVGLLVGALAAATSIPPSKGGLAQAMRTRGLGLTRAFSRIVVAQVWISSINTLFTAIFVLGVLPAFGVELPYAPWLVVFTFVACLLPIVGNLLCNVVLTIAGLSVSLPVAVACLAYLVAVHKTEFAINARIIGSRISTAAWELIAAMFVFETVFGVGGLVAAPLYYAWLKLELEGLGWV